MKKIKVLYPFSTLYPNESGGVSLSQYWLMRGLYETGKIDITGITTNSGIKEGIIKEDNWIETNYGKVKYLKISDRKKFTFFDALKVIKASIDYIKVCDILHIASIFDTISIYTFMIGVYYKKKIVWSTRGSVDDVEFKKKGLLKKIVLFFLRPLVKNVTFHTTSDEETGFAHKYLGKNIRTVQITNYMVLPERLERDKEAYLLFIGRFHHKKGIDNLLKALKLSKYFLGSKYSLKVVGNYENEYGEYIISLVEELELGSKVQFLGHKGSNEKQELLAKAYWSFMPSFSENFGIVTAEALAQGTPVVASIYTPWSSLIENKAGFWVDNTPGILANIIDEIIMMPEYEYQIYSQNASNFVRREFDVFENIEKWVDVYNKIILF